LIDFKFGADILEHYISANVIQTTEPEHKTKERKKSSKRKKSKEPKGDSPI